MNSPAFKSLLFEDGQKIGALTSNYYHQGHLIYAYILMFDGRKERAYGLPAFFDIFVWKESLPFKIYLNCYLSNFQYFCEQDDFIIIKHCDIYFKSIKDFELK